VGPDVVMLLIGFAAGTCFGIVVMGLLAANAYERGGADMVDTLAKRRRPRPTEPPPEKTMPASWLR
jgi:hypothetical protein